MIEHEQRDHKPGGYFTPAAKVVLDPALRTTGLLASLPGEEVKSLLFLLTFVTANGRIEPSLPEVAQAMHVSEGKARDRLLRLQTFLWQGEPLVSAVQREPGSLEVYRLGPHLITARAAAPEVEQVSSASNEPAWIAASREAIIAHSREHYARPRAEVERLVADQLGHTAEEVEDTPEGDVRRRLRALGVPTEQMERLVQNHPLSVIFEQLDWLPHRHAKNPARLIVAAIENRYEPPARVRLERAIAAEKTTEPKIHPLEHLAETGNVLLEVPPVVREGGNDAS